MAKKCKSCNAEMPDEAHFCLSCMTACDEIEPDDNTDKDTGAIGFMKSALTGANKKRTVALILTALLVIALILFIVFYFTENNNSSEGTSENKTAVSTVTDDDGSVITTYDDGSIETKETDGTTITKEPDGTIVTEKSKVTSTTIKGAGNKSEASTIESADKSQNWSNWSTEKPAEGTYSAIEKRTEYRYRDKKTTTSSSATMDGWQLYDTTYIWSDYGSWSSWSSTVATASDSRKVESKTVVDKEAYTAYNYYNYWNGKSWDNGGDWIAFPKSGYTRQDVTDTVEYTYFGVDYGYDAYIKKVDGKTVWVKQYGELWFSCGTTQIPAETHQEYRYADRSKIYTYHFYKWGNWSDWSTNSVSSSDSRQVETRTTYRYKS